MSPPAMDAQRPTRHGRGSTNGGRQQNRWAAARSVAPCHTVNLELPKTSRTAGSCGPKNEAIFLGASCQTWYAGVASIATVGPLPAAGHCGQIFWYHRGPSLHIDGSPKKSFSLRETSPLCVRAPGVVCGAPLSTRFAQRLVVPVLMEPITNSVGRRCDRLGPPCLQTLAVAGAKREASQTLIVSR
eukprot:2545795-Prymnesium_polylepis.1